MWAIGEQKSHENAVIASQIFDILENKKSHHRGYKQRN